MRHYCTVTDINYLPRTLVLYESLKRHSSEPFTLSVLALDKSTEEYIFRRYIGSYEDIDDGFVPELSIVMETIDDITRHYYFADFGTYAQSLAAESAFKHAKESRTWQEFCWTCASQLTESLMIDLGADITYLDADMMFFSDPKQVFDEIGERSIGIIPHRFIPEKAHLAVNGQFNVSWVSFKNTPVGRECLSRWAQQVREKCSATDGCGDQKYLDEWPSLYGDEVCIIQNPGAGLAPWNMANYHITSGPQADGHNVVFFHAHEFAQAADGSYQFSNYHMRFDDVELIWRPYTAAYERAKERIESLRIQSR